MNVSLVEDIPLDVVDLIAQANIGEQFLTQSKWKFVARKDEDLIGVIAYYEAFSKEGKAYPRFVHVILAPKYQKTSYGPKFVRETERLLKKEGFTQITAYILKPRTRMIELAKKNKFIEFLEDEDGFHFYKNL